MKTQFLLTFRHRMTHDITRLRFQSYWKAVAYGHSLSKYSRLLDGYSIWEAEFDAIAGGWYPIKLQYRCLFTNLPEDRVFSPSYDVKKNMLPDYSLPTTKSIEL